MKRLPSVRTLPLSLVFLASGFCETNAATLVWTAESGDWDLASNWDSLIVPTTGDEGLIANNGTALIRAEVPSVASLVAGSGTVLVSEGGSITTTSVLVAGRSGGLGTIDIDEGSVIATATTGSSVRIGETGAGILTVQNGGSLSVQGGDFRLGNGGNSGTLNLSTGGSITFGAAVTDVYFGIEGGNFSTVEHTGGTLTRNTGGNTRIGAFGATGVYNLSGGSATVTGLQLGFAGGGIGTINHSGGTFTNVGEMAIGWDGGRGVYNLSGTGVLSSTGRLRIGVVTASAVGDASARLVQTGGSATIAGRIDIGEGAANTGELAVSGGTLSVTGQGIIFVGAFGGGTGIYRQTGGAVTVGDAVIAGFQAGTTGSIELDGGTLTAQRIQRGEGTGTLSFNGGTAVAAGDNGNFIAGFDQVTIEAGGATIDTNGHLSGVVSPLTGPGGLRKIGTGTLTLTGVNDYQGATLVEAGTLVASSLGLGDLQIGESAMVSLQLATTIDDDADVSLLGTTSVLNLNFAGTETIFSLLVGGEFVAPGLYTAEELNAEYAGQFSGTGSLLVVVPEPTTFGLLAMSFLGLGLRRRALTGRS